MVLVEVERLPTGEKRRASKALWLWWHGGGEPDLDLLWRSYLRRFDVEHTIKLYKGSLGWATPRVRHPEQADRWTWLILAAYTQLRLARGIIADRRLPWEALGTPASAPKLSGQPPGRPKGRLSGRAKSHPPVKKAV